MGSCSIKKQQNQALKTSYILPNQIQNLENKRIDNVDGNRDQGILYFQEKIECSYHLNDSHNDQLVETKCPRVQSDNQNIFPILERLEKNSKMIATMDYDERIIYAYDYIIISKLNILKIIDLTNERSYKFTLNFSILDQIQLIGIKYQSLYLIDYSQNFLQCNFNRNKRNILYKFKNQQFHSIQNRLTFEDKKYYTNLLVLGDNNNNINIFQFRLKQRKIVRKRKLYLFKPKNILSLGHVNLYQFYIINHYNIIIYNQMNQIIQIIQRKEVLQDFQFLFLKNQQQQEQLAKQEPLQDQQQHYEQKYQQVQQEKQEQEHQKPQEQEKQYGQQDNYQQQQEQQGQQQQQQQQQPQEQQQQGGLLEISQSDNKILVKLYDQKCENSKQIQIYQGEQNIQQDIKFNNISACWDSDFRYILFQNQNYCMIYDQTNKKDYPVPKEIICFNTKYVIYQQQEIHQWGIFKIHFENLEPIQYNIYDKQIE